VGRIGDILERLGDATTAFLDTLSSVDPKLVLLGILCHLTKMACTSRAWRNVLVAAYDDRPVPWRPIYGAYVAGVGVNAILPARAGDVLRLYLTHRAIPGSTYTTLLSSTAVLAIADMSLASLLFAFALTQGVLPSVDSLPDLPAFDFAWLFANRSVANVIIVGAIFGVIGLIVWARGHIEDFGRRIGQAFNVLSPPRRYLRTVLPWQLADWGLRLGTIWCFLGAFDIDSSLRNVMLVQVTLSLATLAPATPGGIGTEQAFLTVVLRGSAPASVLLAFSVGMRLTLTLVNALAGIVAIALMLGTFNIRRAVGDARQARSTQEPPSDPPS
jgi:glycosyltransferase 2 family protein